MEMRLDAFGPKCLVSMSMHINDSHEIKIPPSSAIQGSCNNVLFAKMFMCLFTDEQLVGIHLVIWLIHGFASLAFVAAIPCTYFSHLFKAPTNLYWRKLTPKGRLDKIEDIEEQERFGVSEFDQFDWKQRLDFDACTECGRCTEVCPAVKVGAPLDPRAMVKQLKDRLHNPNDKQLVGEIIDKDALWSCTTCGACAQACPVRIDLPTAIVDMRRHLALEEGDFPAGMAPVLIGMCFLGSVQIFFIGLVGEYILTINSRVMRRPLVVEEERLNFDTSKSAAASEKIAEQQRKEANTVGDVHEV